MRIDLQLPETAGWRGLLTQAQQSVQSYLPEAVEEYAVRLLYRMLGSADANLSLRSENFVRQLLNLGNANARSLAAIGDQCLLFAGLFPDHAIRQGIALSYFVSVGQHAYREHAATLRDEDPAVYRALGEHFVATMDILLTIHELNRGGTGLDGLNAYQLWCDTGSTHGWQVLRQMTLSLPAGVNSFKH